MERGGEEMGRCGKQEWGERIRRGRKGKGGKRGKSSLASLFINEPLVPSGISNDSFLNDS